MRTGNRLASLVGVVAVLSLVLLLPACGSSKSGTGSGDVQEESVPFPPPKDDVPDKTDGTTGTGDDAVAPEGTEEGDAPPVEDVGGDAAVEDVPVEDTPTVPPDTKPDKDVPPNKDCVDSDNDGYGDNCFLGKDCDDTNPNFTIYCPPCDKQHQEGCKCGQPGAMEVCYESDPGTVGVGECQLGQRTCMGLYWSGCQGQVVPEPETCDEKDNDCDGTADEGVLSPCGNCDQFCDTLTAGPENPENPFDPTEENSKGVNTNIDGFLILDSTKIDLGFIWVANSGEQTVSRLNTDTGVEMGRYKICSDPSRTAVDLVGNVYAGCRGDGGVAKIAIDEALCTDKNNNGVIDTSHNSQVLPAGQDECILFITYPGGSCARALGVDKDNYPWVGHWNNQTLTRLHPDTGAVVVTVSIPCNPYGLAIDGDGIIWVSGRGGDKLVRVDPNQNPPSVNNWYVPGGNLYGIAIDANGKVWMGQYSNGSVARFDPVTNSFSNYSGPMSGHCPRGMAGSADGFMYSGMGCGGDHWIAKIDINNFSISLMETNGPKGSCSVPIGVAIDSKGKVWGVCNSTNNASKVDPATGEVFGPYPVGSSPYTYSDMTGYALNTFTAPQGSYATTFGGWEEIRVKWTAVYVEADIPESSYLKLDVRTADSKEEIANTPWQGSYGPYPPELFPLDLTQVPAMEGKLLEVRVWLFSKDKMSTPVVKAIKAKFSSQ